MVSGIAPAARPPGAPDPDANGCTPVTLVVSEVRGELVALELDRVAGQTQVYVKPLPDHPESSSTRE